MIECVGLLNLIEERLLEDCVSSFLVVCSRILVNLQRKNI